MSEKDRYAYVQKAERCVNCFRKEHQKPSDCPSESRCKEGNCPVRYKHNPMLHQGFRAIKRQKQDVANGDGDDDEQEANFLDTCLHHCSETNVEKFLNIIPITVTSSTGKQVSTFGILDPCASFNAIADKLADLLDLEAGPVQSMVVNTIQGKKPMEVKTTKATISGNGKNMPKFELLLQIVKKSRLSFSRVPSWKDVDPSIIEEFKLSYSIDIPYVTVLVGADPRIHRALESRILDSGLLLTKTALGVAIMGAPNQIKSNKVHLHEANFLHAETMPEKFFWDNETASSVYDTRKVPSYEDRIAQKIIEDSTVRREDGRFEIRPPWRKIPPDMPDNRAQVRYRFNSLAKRFAKDPEYFHEYSKVINSYLEDGHAEKVPSTELDRPKGQKFYIPHHHVDHPRKNIRVVFDTASETDGRSLSTEVYPGPDVLNSLVGVLIRFRQGKVPVTADLRRYYHSVYLPKSDVDFFRYFWFSVPDDPTSPIQEYRLLIHLFGGCWSQAVCAHGLLRAILDAVKPGSITSEEAQLLLRAFYSDDFARSYASTLEALESVLPLIDILSKSGFVIAKFQSPDLSLMDKIPTNLHHPDAESEVDDNTVLGIHWSVSNDTFWFSIEMVLSQHQTKTFVQGRQNLRSTWIHILRNYACQVAGTTMLSRGHQVGRRTSTTHPSGGRWLDRKAQYIEGITNSKADNRP